MFTSISMARTAARKRQNVLPLQPVKQVAGAGYRPARAWRTENSHERLLPWVAVPEIEAVYARMKPVWAHIRLYGVSIGAWLAMQALQGDAPEQALLVSPVVDMEALITNMMQYAHVTEEQLHRQGDPHGSWGDPLMAVSVLGAGTSAALAWPHAGAVW